MKLAVRPLVRSAMLAGSLVLLASPLSTLAQDASAGRKGWMDVRDCPAEHPGPWKKIKDTPEQATLRKELAGKGRIVFSSNRDGNWDIYVTEPDGSGRRNLTNSPSWDSYPRWTADGARIVFFSDRDAEVKMSSFYDQTMDRPAEGAWGFHRGRARYGPDKEVAMMAGCGVYVMNADGGNVKRLVQNAHRPAISPDGRLLAFERAGKSVTRDLKTGKEWDAVMRYFGGSWFPTFSPEGRRILVASGGDIKGATGALEQPPKKLMATVFDLKPGGKPVSKWWNVSLGSMNLMPRWRPDGKALVLVRGSRELELVEVAFTEKPDDITGLLNGRTIGLAEPADRYMHAFPAYCPNGQYIAFSLSPIHYLIRKKVAPLGYKPWHDGHQIVWQELCVGRAVPGKDNVWIQLTDGGYANIEADWFMPKKREETPP